jgi:hypothetical protein
MKIFTKKRLLLALGLLAAGVATAAWINSIKEKPIVESKYRTAVVPGRDGHRADSAS